jgi:hypothetical protein
MSSSKNRDFSKIAAGLIVFTAVLSINTLLVKIIWNNVIIKKFPKQNIEKLDFWEALAMSVFFSLVQGVTLVKMCHKY